MSKIFDEHIMPVAPKMHRYACSILGNTETAHDVVQDCLIKIWNKRTVLDNVANPEAWAMRIVRNQCYDWVKTNRFKLESIDQAAEQKHHQTDESFLIADQHAWLEKVIELLPEKQREIFYLRETMGSTYQEMAVVMDIQVNEVKVLLHRARTKIRETMQKIDAYGVAN